MNNQDDNFLSHHGVEGMKWGVRHDPERKGYGNRRPHNQKGQPPLSQREIAKRERAIYKKKKLPKTSLGLLLRNRNLSEAEYRQAKKKIERDRDVYEGFLRDIQNIQRTLDIPVNALNSGVKTVKNIDYINTLFGGTSFTDRKTSTRNNKWKKKFDSELKIVHSNMNLPSLVHSDTEDIDNFLCHYGVIGMKWGQHIFGDEETLSKKYGYSREEANRRLNNQDAFYNKHILRRNGWLKPWNAWADKSEKFYSDLNKKYDKKYSTPIDWDVWDNNDKNQKAYIKECAKGFKDGYKAEIEKVYGNYAKQNLPENYYEIFPFYNQFDELLAQEKKRK